LLRGIGLVHGLQGGSLWCDHVAILEKLTVLWLRNNTLVHKVCSKTRSVWPRRSSIPAFVGGVRIFV
jgi:hypothetical protein